MSIPTTTAAAKPGLWQDRKFRWLIASVALVSVFEFLSLMGGEYKLRRSFAFPFFAVLILAVGWRTLWSGLKALAKVNFRSSLRLLKFE